jgi:predicted short-subunit dehydrogenase-like oxidoreductase (DUF2520 family)
MRELERPPDTSAAPVAGPVASLAIIGRGRLGSALATALRDPASSGSELRISEPLGRNPDLTGFDAVLLCVPDAAIEAAAASVPSGRLVGHCSGASGLGLLAPHEAFSVHPLMTLAAGAGRERFVGAGAAIAGSTPAALDFARRLAERLQMRSFELAEEDRTAYHAAASIASNFLVTLEAAAERLAAGTGAGHEVLVPLVRATVENWAALGAERALTGPIVRGDERTVTAQRDAVAARAPELLAMFDSLVEVTRTLVSPTPAALA